MKGYERYVRGVLDGSIVAGKNIRLMCERFVMMRGREDIYFDDVCVDEAISFISNIKHFLGKSAGKYFILEPWQEFVISCILGLKWKRNTYIGS